MKYHSKFLFRQAKSQKDGFVRDIKINQNKEKEKQFIPSNIFYQLETSADLEKCGSNNEDLSVDQFVNTNYEDIKKWESYI